DPCAACGRRCPRGRAHPPVSSGEARHKPDSFRHKPDSFRRAKPDTGVPGGRPPRADIAATAKPIGDQRAACAGAAGRGDPTPHPRGRQHLNLVRLPVPPLPPAVEYTEEGPAAGGAGAQTPSSRRSLATCPVAFTPYIARSIRPSGPITKVDLITPTTVRPYICFSP